MTTKPSIHNLYQKLLPEELAGLAFEASMRKDNDEYDAILASVDKQPYICLNQRFVKHNNGLMDLALFYGMTYWRTRTYLMSADSLQNAQGNTLTENLINHFVDSLRAMDVALQWICAEHGIDVISVKKLSFCDSEYIFEKSEESGLVAEYIDIFNRLIK
jgi:hypothetical protein